MNTDSFVVNASNRIASIELPRVKGRPLIRAAIMLVVMISTSVPVAARQLFENLARFGALAPNGANPCGGLTEVSSFAGGEFYGTTQHGGAFGYGAVYVVSPAGLSTVLHSFQYIDGAYPCGDLVEGPNGMVYGTTTQGGDFDRGTVFKVDQLGAFTIHSFGGTQFDGAFPYGALVKVGDFFYGTTSAGGLSGGGTIFRMDFTGSITTIHSFEVDFSNPRGNGFAPYAGLILGKDFALYGTTRYGGSFEPFLVGLGTIFKFEDDFAGGQLTVLHRFVESGYPNSPLLQTADENFYGTTALGTVFRWGPAGFTTLVSSSQIGFSPEGVIQATDGQLYGVTREGAFSRGTVFSIDPLVGQLSSVYALFPPKGLYPTGRLIQARDGRLYGTTQEGGASGLGTVFRVEIAENSPGAIVDITTLHAFESTGQPAYPSAGLLQTPDGHWYGTTTAGGTFGYGTVFKLDGSRDWETGGFLNVITLHNFSNGDGAVPNTELIQGADGALYGTTAEGGALGDGTVFRIDSNGTVTTLHSLSRLNGDGRSPSGLMQGIDGNFYGTTLYGGVGWGSIFRMDLQGNLTTLYSLSFDTDGLLPSGGLVQGVDGNLYGTTRGGAGPAQYGTVFKFDPRTGTFTTLHTFTSIDGAYPSGGVVFGSDGSLYGTTSAGGFGRGTLFRLNVPGTLLTIHTFSSFDGADPHAGLLLGDDGSLYGTTSTGGIAGVGTVFRLDSTNTLTTLRSFSRQDGATPDSRLIQGRDGSIYGTTKEGGSVNTGVIFRLKFPKRVSTSEDIPVSGQVSALAGNPQTFSIADFSTLGIVVVTPETGAFTYTPNADVSGTDSFTVEARDTESGYRQSVTVIVTILPVNDRPVAQNGVIAVSSPASASGSFVATDIDSVSLNYVIVTNGAKGTATLTNALTGAYTYAPNANATGTDTLTFKAIDDGLLESNEASVTVTITPPPSCATDITATVELTQGSPRLDKKTGQYVQTVTLRNSDGAITGPVSLVLDNLSGNAVLFNGNGLTTCASPLGSSYIHVNVGSDALFKSRERATVTLKFENPTGQPITYTPRVLGGILNR